MSSEPPSPRINRGSGPKGKMKEWNYRSRSLRHLLTDFESRCAYSMRHTLRAGVDCAEVDHFNPKLKNSLRHRYSNLMLAFRSCNNKKSNHWPTSQMQREGVRFLNPTKERDYGAQIFEDPQTGKLIPTSPAAFYHIEMLGLNAATFVRERVDRRALAKLFPTPDQLHFGGSSPAEMLKSLTVIRDLIQNMIPPIPELPADQSAFPPDC